MTELVCRAPRSAVLSSAASRSFDGHCRRTGGGMLEGVGEGLLDDAVRGQVEIAGQPQCRIHGEPDVDTRVVEPFDQLGQLSQSRSRGG